MNIAVVGDIHVGTSSHSPVSSIIEEASQSCDILLLAGDLTEQGLTEEAELLAKDLSSCPVPVVAVLGNHDYEAGKEKEITKILSQANVTVLDGTYFIYRDVGIAGVKGFGGGFNKHMVSLWGESAFKTFVRESINEALKLERALSLLPTQKKVALLHYSPIEGTVEGEPKEIYPFLGTSRLEDPIDRYDVSVVFHGHAHAGTQMGKTSKNIDVFNTAYALMQSTKKESFFRYSF